MVMPSQHHHIQNQADDSTYQYFFTAQRKHGGADLAGAKVEGIAVQQELRLVEELRHQLLDVAGVVQAVVPGGGYVVEQPVGMVEAPSLPFTRSSRSIVLEICNDMESSVDYSSVCKRSSRAYGLLCSCTANAVESDSDDGSMTAKLIQKSVTSILP